MKKDGCCLETKPKHLYRDDGERFTLNKRGRYQMDKTGMANPYEWGYHFLMSKGFFTRKRR